MLFLTSLCEGVLGAQWAFCLSPWDTFSGQIGTSLQWWIRGPATSQLSGEQPQWVRCPPAFLSAHRKLPAAASQSLCSLQWSESWRKCVFWDTTRGELPAQRPQQEPGFKSWSTLLLASGQGTRNTFKPATTGHPHALSGTSQGLSVPHRVWPNLTLISLSYLVSHVNMKGI